MNAVQFIHSWTMRDLLEDELSLISEDSQLRIDLINFLKINPNREFALYLLEKILSKRKEQNQDGAGDNMMYASYLLGMHGNIDDSLLIWRAKNIDFDAFVM